MYWIPCSCGEVYIGTTKQSIQTRVKEHERHCRLYQPEKSSIASHMLETGHKIMFEKTKVLAKTSHYYAKLRRKSIEIHKLENNFNKREESLKLNKTWFPALRNRKIGN